MSRTNTKRAVFIIILWSFAVHVPGLSSPLLDYHAYRQCQTVSMSRNYVRYGMNFLNPEIDTAGVPQRTGTEFPIYSYILAIFFKLFGVHEIFGRLLSMVFAAWGAVFLFLFVKRRLGDRIALWSALVMCALPIHIYFTRTVQPEPMALWGLLGFLCHGDRWFYTNPGSKNWLLAVLLGALAPLLKLPFLYLVVPLWIYLGLECFGLPVLRNTAWWAALALILGSTAAWYAYAKTAPVSVLPLSAHDHLANLAPVLSPNLWRAQFVSRIPELVMTYSGLLFAVVGFYYYRRAKTFLFFAAWLILSFLYVPLLGQYGLIHRYTLLPLAPIVAVWIACGITSFWEHAKGHPLTRAMALVLIVGIPVHAALRIGHWYHLEYSYIPRAKAAITRAGKPDDLVMVVSHETPEILYYLDRYGYPAEPENWTPQEVSAILHHAVRFVLVPKDDNAKSMDRWKAYLAPRTRLVENDPAYLLYKVR